MTGRTTRSTTKPRELGESASSTTEVLSLDRLRRKGLTARKARETEDKHAYFVGVAEARYVLRKVFRIVEDEAKKYGIEPLAHQALIQIYGSENMALQVNQVAARLDITPSFASSMVRALVEKELVVRLRDENDQRVTHVAISKTGQEVMDAIDENVKVHVDYFLGQVSVEQRESALSILMFYVGAKL